MGTTTADVHKMIRSHFLPENRPAAGVLAEEIESPDGKRRADALWMPITYSGDRGLTGMEVKVSRADLLAELADPTKADAWGRYCTWWYLVIPDPALIEGLDDRIPEHWGVYGPPSGRRTRSMTPLRPARKCEPVGDTGPAFRRIAVWLEHRRSETVGGLRRDLQWKERELVGRDREIDRLRAAAVAGGHSADPMAAKVLAIMKAARAEATRRKVYLAMGGIDVDRIARALIDLEEIEDVCDTARYELGRLQHAAEQISQGMTSTARDLAGLQAPKVEVPAVAS